MKDRLLRYNLIFFFPYFLVVAAIVLLSLFPFHALEVFADQPVSTELTDRHGKILRVLVLEDGTRRQYVPLKSISDETRNIFLMSEDRRFYLHPGVDPLALARGIFQLMTGQSSVSGGSTISMQLARMMRFSHTNRPIWRRKLGEMVTAIRIEQKISKKRILELWLNNLPFGSQVEGIASAAWMFYNRDLDQLSRAQVVSLALIPRNPTKYNPITQRQTVIERAANMVRHLDLNIPIDVIRQDIAIASWGRWPHEAEHFTRLVAGGLEENDTPQTLPTSLDLDFQLLLENRIAVHLDQKSDSRISNAAGLLIRNSTGEILAYAGSQDFNDTAFGGQIDGVQVRNQPGSTIKPFLFALAFENGYGPNDLLPDIPTDFGGTMIYVPRNFDERYHGPVRLRTALASSLNVPATALAADLGVKQFALFLLELGFASIEAGVQGGYPSAGLGIALGNSPVSLFELVRAFSVFPRGGEFTDLSWHRNPDPAIGNGNQRTRQVVSQATADMVSHILMDPFERTLGFGMDDPFYVDFPVMVKTGTASRYQNIWALAAAGDFTIGIWLGNFSGETVIGRTGSSVPASIALEVLAELPGVMNGDDRILEALIPLKICSVSGEKAGANCTGSRIEYFLPGSDPDLCSFHPEQEFPGNVSYPANYLAWIDSYGRSGTTEYSDMLKIVSPANGSTFFYDPGLPTDMQALKVLVMHDPGADVSLIVNGREMPERVPEKAGLSSWLVPLEPGKWTISAISAGRRINQVLEVRP